MEFTRTDSGGTLSAHALTRLPISRAAGSSGADKP